MCDDECPNCGARDISPADSDDLTEIVEQKDGAFAVLRSSEGAEHKPDYREIARFQTVTEATAFLSSAAVEPYPRRGRTGQARYDDADQTEIRRDR